MNDLRHDKKVTVELDVPLKNSGRTEGGRYDPKLASTFYEGRVEVSEQTAEDLLRRQKEYHNYERSLIRDNGMKNLDAGNIVGNQA